MVFTRPAHDQLPVEDIHTFFHHSALTMPDQRDRNIQDPGKGLSLIIITDYSIQCILTLPWQSITLAIAPTSLWFITNYMQDIFFNCFVSVDTQGFIHLYLSVDFGPEAMMKRSVSFILFLQIPATGILSNLIIAGLGQAHEACRVSKGHSFMRLLKLL